jgi:hypothetical protein
MFVHTVYFWLKQDLTAEQIREFREGVESLRGIAAIEELYIGTPAATHRPVIDRSYSLALTVLVKGLAEHDQYQEDPIHLAFVSRFSSYWERVVIYDAE